MKSLRVVARFAPIASIILSITILVLTTLSSAAPIRVDYGGSLTSVDSLLSPPFMVGDTYTGSYVFDSNAPDIGTSGNGGDFAATNFSVTFSTGYNVTANMGEIETRLTSSQHTYSVRSRNLIAGTVNGNFPIDFLLRLTDSSVTALQSTAIPTTIDLNDFDSRQFFFGFSETGPDGDNNVGLAGTVTSLSFTPVPVPSAMLLMGTGLLGLIGYRKWNTKTT